MLSVVLVFSRNTKTPVPKHRGCELDAFEFYELVDSRGRGRVLVEIRVKRLHIVNRPKGRPVEDSLALQAESLAESASLGSVLRLSPALPRESA